MSEEVECYMCHVKHIIEDDDGQPYRCAKCEAEALGEPWPREGPKLKSEERSSTITEYFDVIESMTQKEMKEKRQKEKDWEITEWQTIDDVKSLKEYISNLDDSMDFRYHEARTVKSLKTGKPLLQIRKREVY